MGWSPTITSSWHGYTTQQDEKSAAMWHLLPRNSPVNMVCMWCGTLGATCFTVAYSCVELCVCVWGGGGGAVTALLSTADVWCHPHRNRTQHLPTSPRINIFQHINKSLARRLEVLYLRRNDWPCVTVFNCLSLGRTRQFLILLT
jgi:hypothetical protein